MDYRQVGQGEAQAVQLHAYKIRAEITKIKHLASWFR